MDDPAASSSDVVSASAAAPAAADAGGGGGGGSSASGSNSGNHVGGSGVGPNLVGVAASDDDGIAFAAHAAAVAMSESDAMEEHAQHSDGSTAEGATGEEDNDDPDPDHDQAHAENGADVVVSEHDAVTGDDGGDANEANDADEADAAEAAEGDQSSDAENNNLADDEDRNAAAPAAAPPPVGASINVGMAAAVGGVALHTSLSPVCRICGRGDEDGRPMLRFLPVEHDVSAAAAAPSVITFSQDISLHIFCGKTASILPTVNQPDLEILTKAGLKNKHGIGPEVNAALARTRCAVLQTPGSKEKQFYLVREFEAHLAAIRHTHITFLPEPNLQHAAAAPPGVATSNSNHSSLNSMNSLGNMGVVVGNNHAAEALFGAHATAAGVGGEIPNLEASHQQQHHLSHQHHPHHHPYDPAGMPSMLEVPTEAATATAPSGGDEAATPPAPGASLSLPPPLQVPQQQQQQQNAGAGAGGTTASGNAQPKEVPFKASVGHISKPGNLRGPPDTVPFGGGGGAQEMTFDGKIRCGCGGTHLPTGTPRGVQSWRNHVMTKRHQKWMEENGLLGAV